MTLKTDKHASVPELQNLTISTDGTLSMTIFAKVFSNSHGAPNEVPFLSCLINAELT
jgi:hypothetical protein|tara:strand:- start:134 stop:304 length:171 start_codon:yes stop_codon:yes gene_type:complete